MAATGTHSAGAAPAMNSSQSMSRPFCSGALSWDRWSTTQRAGLCRLSSMAPSSSGLYGITRLTSIPHDPATMSLGLASSIRLASSLAAKPPKTTEWMAPMRAQASIGITASGTMGM